MSTSLYKIKDLPDLLETHEAAAVLRRKEQTLRCWAMRGNGPLQPVRLHSKGGRLLWPRAQILALIGINEEGADIGFVKKKRG